MMEIIPKTMCKTIHYLGGFNTIDLKVENHPPGEGTWTKKGHLRTHERGNL